MNFEQIHAYVDGELSQEEAAQFEAKLQTCADTKREFESAKNVKSTLQNKCVPVENAALWQKCQARFRELDTAQRTEQIVNKFRWVLASFVAVAIFGAAFFNRINPKLSVGSENFASALSASPSSAATNVGVKPSDWLSQQMGIPVSVPNLESKGLKMERMEMLDMQGNSVARISYSDGRFPYVLMVFKGMKDIEGAPVEGKPGMCCGEIGRMNVVAWEQGGVALMFAGLQSPQELASFVK